MLLALCAGNSPVTGEFPTQRPVMQSFGVFFDLRQNKRLSKQWWGWWFETPSCPSLHHCNEMLFIYIYFTIIQASNELNNNSKNISLLIINYESCGTNFITIYLSKKNVTTKISISLSMMIIFLSAIDGISYHNSVFSLLGVFLSGDIFCLYTYKTHLSPFMNYLSNPILYNLIKENPTK